MKNMFFVIILGLVALSACSKTAPQSISVTDKDNGSQINMRAGGKLEIKLEGNATTGYLWEVSRLDKQILQQEEDLDYKAQSDLAGAPGITRFRFAAVAAGNTTIELIYRRPWEKDKPPEKLFQINVTVK